MNIRATLVSFALLVAMSAPANASDGGFDQYGYNYQARTFVGLADGVDRVLDGTVWGDPTYAYDRLVMHWSQAWDDARFSGAAWTPDAWEDNEWDGACTGCSGEVWHYKIVWSQTCRDAGVAPQGGYCVWGEFAVLMDQGATVGAGHTWLARVTPAGYGGQ